jgi:hypothetical protein
MQGTEMSTPHYLGLEGARVALEQIGIHLTTRQIKRAADPDANGQRKLPFFVDPIDKRLKIEKGTLLAIYLAAQSRAETDAKVRPESIQKKLEP